MSATSFLLVGALGSRPGYIYDRADIISSETETLLDSYLRKVDDATTTEIVIYTIPSFIGHGIKKNDQEIQERDMLANYIFNEVLLDGLTGIGKKGKDNGVLILFSLERDAGGGSMRIEIGKGLEGEITDGTAGVILDSFLVPARGFFEETGDTTVFDQAFFDTAITLAERAGYVSDDPSLVPSQPLYETGDEFEDPLMLALIVIFFGGFIAVAILSSRRRRRRGFYGGGFGGGGFGGGGGGFGGGGGRSGGGGAGR